MRASDVESALLREVGSILHESPADLDPSRSLSELGVDSLGYCRVSAFVEREFGVVVPPAELFEFPSVQTTAAHVAGLAAGVESSPAVSAPAVAAPVAEAATYSTRDIAIIGLALKFPGANDPQQYWDLIRGGASVIGDFPSRRAPASAIDNAGYLKGGFVDGADAFDASFFGISPREAVAMDPQQRLLLECAWHAFESAGYSTARLSGSNAAVFVGASSFDYYELLLRTQSVRTTHIGTGVSHAVIANRVSQQFNLRGASEAIDTACSSGLVALWRAVETLRRGESDLALVGGVNVLASQTPFQVFADAGMLSQEGACRPFDARAAGYVRGEGVGCVLVKRAADAVRDGDRIRAVIKGGAVRHGGRTNSLTAPSPDAQADVIVAAFADADVDPITIGYIEAHGTGTSLGDPIEASGLKRAFRRLHADRGRTEVAPHFIVGSVKAQIGHLEAAAGLAGLLKAVLALEQRAIPGSPYLSELNPQIDLADACFRFSSETTSWDEPAAQGQPRRAAVSSFGFGGVNAHVVLEEAPALPPRRSDAPGLHLLVLSAKSADALRARSSALAAALAAQSFASADEEQTYLADLAFTLRRKTAHAHRLALVTGSVAELATLLRQPTPSGPNVAAGVAQAGTHEAMGLFDSEAEVEERLRSLVAAGELRKLAALWVKGFAIEWDRIAPPVGERLVTTPGYPFARESFWVTFNTDARPGGPEGPTPRHPAADARVEAGLHARNTPDSPWSVYAEGWADRPLGDPSHEARTRDGAVIALVDGPVGRRVADLVGQHRRLLVASPSDAPMAELIIASAGQISGLLDLTALDGVLDHSSSEARARLDFVRQLIGGPLRKGAPIEVVQATAGLQRVGTDSTPVSLAGAQESGLYKSLWAEYRRCASKTVDFERDPFVSENAAAALARELDQHDGPSELAYRNGRRLARTMERVSLGPAQAEADRNGVALITGGTGDIGLALANDLAGRGFRAVLLTGRREPGPERQRTIDALATQGVSVALYRGDLCDEAALRTAIDDFRALHGGITHVFHCAGAVSHTTPAFFQKTADSMAEVMQPKVDALWVLHRLMASAPPRAFVLFSSISAVAPRLASGVLDYAAANRFLDFFARYQHAHGHSYYRSVQWTRWRQMGLARSANETATAASALAPEHCFEALHRIVSADGPGPVVCVTTPGDASLAPQALERASTAESARPIAPASASADRLAVRPVPGAPTAGFDVVLRKVRAIVARELEIDESRLDNDAHFVDLGIDSIVLVGIVGALDQWLGKKIDPTDLIKCNSLAAVARHLAGTHDVPAAVAAPAEAGLHGTIAGPAEAGFNGAISGPAEGRLERTTPPAPSTRPSQGSFPVAVIGIACRFPGAPNKETFWRNLVAGVDSVSTVPSSRWDCDAVYAPRHQAGKTVSKWGGFIDGIERVNPAMFGLGPEEAADLDPLIRLFTETSLAAVLDSPYDQVSLKGRRVGVFAGARAGRYAERISSPGKHSVTGVGQNFIAAFVSHVLDLRGPSLVLDSACSSSLAAVHLACQSLQCGDSELAIAGGVDLLLDEKAYLFLSAAHALSPDGRCRTFDEKANGFVAGEGVGCVLLKPLAQALADGDHVYAVVDGSAINNDGRTLGVTTPGVEGQVDVIERALEKAAATPRSVSYVEAHGTGTMIGDPIELRALARVFAKDSPSQCAIGSVKTNVGHLLSAAGIASFIKVALALHHRTLPPTLHCDRANPRFEFERTPFRPIGEARPWAPEAGVRRAGISAFGFGKTNVHVIVSERPEQARRPVDLEAAPAAIAETDKIYAWHPPASPAWQSSPGLLELETLTSELLDEA